MKSTIILSVSEMRLTVSSSTVQTTQFLASVSTSPDFLYWSYAKSIVSVISLFTHKNCVNTHFTDCLHCALCIFVGLFLQHIDAV